ncbi:MAG: S41 family peptidase [Puniceicoccales bacterium]|jgi:carboxyl-terminal processing protease|nr:S41 family peptidase [Puniceicoccales bacterium]
MHAFRLLKRERAVNIRRQLMENQDNTAAAPPAGDSSSKTERAPVTNVRRFVRTFFLCCFSAIAAYMVAILATSPESRLWFQPSFIHAWLRVARAMSFTHVNYVTKDDVSHEKLAARAIAGAVSGLDKYSEYLPPADYESFEQRLRQTYVGIGVSWRALDGECVILSVSPGSGAAEGGVKAGDRVIKVNGEATTVAQNNFWHLVQGAEGTSAVLEILREGSPEPLLLRVERRRTHLPTVVGTCVLNGATGYLRVTRFERHTAEEISAAVNLLVKKGIRRLVIDFRDNPGGQLLAAVRTVGLFCPRGTLVTTLEERSGAKKHTTTDAPIAPALPLAVLVNRNSASASEIVSGALQDLRRAIVVGERTLGKGVAQTVFRLKEGDGLRLTTARYTLPSGRSIQDNGVSPDIHQPLTARAAELLSIATAWRELDADHAFFRRHGTPPPEDIQLAAAVDALLAMEESSANAIR